MKHFFVAASAAILIGLSLNAQNPPKGYYKDIFMDSGVMLTSRKVLPVTDILGLSMEAFISTPHRYDKPNKFTARDTLRQHELIVGSEIDENGVLFYPDGQPRFRMVYMNGGRAKAHLLSIGDDGKESYRKFVAAGGSYLGSCAGAFMASKSIVKANGKMSREGFDLGLWPGSAQSTGLNKSYTGMDIVKKNPLAKYYDFGGTMHVDSVYHNGGCRAYMATAPKGTEVLAVYDTKGRGLKYDLTGDPCIWAWKASESAGRVIMCGSHPEGCAWGENLALMSAMVRYALDGTAPAKVKGALESGESRIMTARTSDSDPDHTRIGDRQYHHFTVEVPAKASKLEIRLEGVEGENDFDVFLFANKKGLAFSDNSPWTNVKPGMKKKIVIEKPAKGTWYVSVFCNTTVNSKKGEYGVEYFGRTDVLNGVPYVVTATVE